MVEIGYAMSSEEHSPLDLVRYARMAEENSPFVWSAIAVSTSQIRLGTGVTCPTMRTHQAIIAQAATTASVMMEGRFFLGVGTGENLNEHVTGARWPAFDVQGEMLEEAVEVMRLLWQGSEQSHYGKHYTVENTRIYTLPDTPPPVMSPHQDQNRVNLQRV